MNNFKKYLKKKHTNATIEDYNNQRHRMHIIQAIKPGGTKHTGSKNLKQLLALGNRQ